MESFDQNRTIGKFAKDFGNLYPLYLHPGSRFLVEDSHPSWNPPNSLGRVSRLVHRVVFRTTVSDQIPVPARLIQTWWLKKHLLGCIVSPPDSL
jgi:hypothetical protein